jgi:hypothetical protein
MRIRRQRLIGVISLAILLSAPVASVHARDVRTGGGCDSWPDVPAVALRGRIAAVTFTEYPL